MIHWTAEERAALEAERDEIRERLRYLDVLLAAYRPDDEAPTQKLPPLRDSVFRRPPVPPVRELGRAELLRALALEIQAEDPSSVTVTEEGPEQ